MKITENRRYPASLRPEAADGGVAHSCSLSGWFQQCHLDWPRVWEACTRRTNKWRVPPQWSRRAWREELDAECLAAACRAIHIFDPERGPTLDSFVYHTVLADALARYRREWTYFLRYGASSSYLEHRLDGTDTVDARFATDEENQDVLRVIKDLPDPERDLIERLFWEGRTEKDVAGGLGITQQAVSKRKHKVLNGLRITLSRAGQASNDTAAG
jgi:RNA polymerase sigma factor (sigma-70 family)